MACKYYFNIDSLSEKDRESMTTAAGELVVENKGGKEQRWGFAHDSVHGLLSDIIELNGINALFEENPELCFYDASISVKDENQLKLNKAIKESAGKTGKGAHDVIDTEILAEFKKRSPKPIPLDADTDPMKFARRFQKDLGTAIHKCIQTYKTADYEKSCDELNKLCKDAQDLKVTSTSPYFSTACGNFLSSNTFMIGNNDWIDNFVIPIWKSCQFDKYSPLFEQKLSYTSPTGATLTGVMDAVYVDDEGIVHIFDFKSSATSYGSNLAEKDHYAQLYIYQQMLSSYGIPASQIKIHNAFVTYSSGTMEAGAAGIDKGYIFSQSNMHDNPSSTIAEINYRLRHHFPLRTATVTTEEARELSTKAKTLRKNLFTEAVLNKEEPENLITYFKKIGEDKPYHSVSLSASVLLKVDGDNITISYLDGKTPKMVKNLDTFVAEELEAQKLQYASIVDQYKAALRTHNTADIEALMSQRDNRNLNVAMSLGKYMSPNWEVVDDVEVFDESGIIVMYNSADKVYDFVSLVQNVNFEAGYHLTYDTEKSMNILGNIASRNELKKYRDANMSAKLGDIRILQTLLTLSQGRETLRAEGDFKVGEIKIVSTVTGHCSFVLDYVPYLTQLKIVADIAKHNPSAIENGEDFQNASQVLDRISFGDTIAHFQECLEGLWFTLPDSFDTKGIMLVNEIQTSMTETNLTDRIHKLEELQDKLRDSFHNELAVKDAYSKPATTVLQQIDRNLSNLIAALRGVATDQAYETSGMGVDYNNSFRAARSFLRNGDVSRFTPDGILLTGFLQGLSTATPYANPDKTVQMLSQLHTYGTTQVQMQAERHIEEINKATSEWLKTKESLAATLLVGNHREFYKQLFQTGSDGKIDPNFRFKNPFTDSSLTDADKNYLKVLLWSKIRISDSGHFTEEEKKKSYVELARSKDSLDKFIRLLSSDPNSLNVPLRTATDARIVLNFSKALAHGDWKTVKDQWKRKLEKSRNWWDPSGLTDKQLHEKEEKMKTLQVYNIYAESLTDRHNRLSNTSIDSFEFNMNYVMNDYVYSYVTANVNKKLLRTTDEMIAMLSYIQDLTGRDLSAQLEEIKKRTRISIYNTNTVESDYKDLAGFVSHLRTAVNFGKIAFRPMLMAKEITVGRMKNFLYASMKYFENEGITVSDMAKAEKIVWGEGIFQDKWDKYTGKMNPGDRSKVEALNWLYRVANMDANVLSAKTIADKHGIMNQGGDIAYYTNTRPDWYNRLSIFVAKMIADGSWEAHSLDENNHLIYDMSKDKRYSIFYKYRKTPPKPGSADYSTYQKQKNIYAYNLQSMIEAGLTNPDGTPLKFGDDLPIAYTPKETNSIKELTGMLYGYYNHEEKTSFQTGTYSQLFMAFKTYLAGEIKHYFALPNANTSRGKVAQLTDGIPTESNPNGSLLWEQVDAETGLVKIVTNQFNEDGSENAPHVGWVATPQEGLFVSAMKCLADIFTEEGRKDLRTNKFRRRQAELFLIRMLMASVFAALGVLIFGNTDKDDEHAQAALYALDIAKKAGNDLSFYHSVIEPVDDMGFVGMDYLKGLGSSVLDIFTDGDKELQSLVYNNLQFAKDFQPN